LERWDGVMWTGLVWLRIGTGGELFHFLNIDEQNPSDCWNNSNIILQYPNHFFTVLAEMYFMLIHLKDH
jgi:hypothetical protein